MLRSKISISLAMTLSLAAPLSAIAATDEIKIEAENFIAQGGSFDDLQPTPISTYAVNGLEAINYVNSGDFVDYNVDVATAGMYEVSFNIGTAVTSNSAIEVLVYEDGKWISYGTSSVPATDWDDFSTVTPSTMVKLPAGLQTVRIHALGSNDWQWNLESFNFVWKSNISGTVDEIKVEAENFIAQGGTFDDGQPTAVTTYSTNGQEAINYVNSGDYVDYNVNVATAGMYEVSFNIGTAVTTNSAVEILVYEDGKWVSYAYCSVPATGWDDFSTLTAATTVKLPAGLQTVRIHAFGSNNWQWNLESFNFIWESDIPEASAELNDIAKSGYASQNLNTYNVASLPVPARIEDGKEWVEQTALSDNFNYQFSEKNYKTNFGPNNRWYNFYHNAWNGPGTTYWQYNHVSVNGNELEIRTSRNSSTQKMNVPGVNAGCITSNNRVIYPVFVETSISLANISLASDVWLLSPDDTQEIDIIEAYGGVSYFEKFIHLSHHSFVRQPFQDYQPRDYNSWWERNGVNSWGDYSWNNGQRKYIQVGVNWVSPKHFEYYIDGELVRVVYHNAFATKGTDGIWRYTQPYLTANGAVAYNGGYQAVSEVYGSDTTFSQDVLQAASDSNNVSAIDPLGYQGGNGFTKAMDIIINVESQEWLVADQSPSSEDLADPDKNTMRVDWIRVFKPEDN